MPNTRRHVLFDFQNNLIQFRTMPRKFQKKNIDQLISHSIGFFSTRRILTRCRKRGKKTSDVLRCRSLSHIYGTHNELRVYVYVWADLTCQTNQQCPHLTVQLACLILNCESAHSKAKIGRVSSLANEHRYASDVCKCIIRVKQGQLVKHCVLEFSCDYKLISIFVIISIESFLYWL